jgi:hypothetical protein
VISNLNFTSGIVSRDYIARQSGITSPTNTATNRTANASALPRIRAASTQIHIDTRRRCGSTEMRFNGSTEMRFNGSMEMRFCGFSRTRGKARPAPPRRTLT